MVTWPKDRAGAVTVSAGRELRFGYRLWFRGDAVCLRKLRGRRCRIGLLAASASRFMRSSLTLLSLSVRRRASSSRSRSSTRSAARRDAFPPASCMAWRRPRLRDGLLGGALLLGAMSLSPRLGRVDSSARRSSSATRRSSARRASLRPALFLGARVLLAAPPLLPRAMPLFFARCRCSSASSCFPLLRSETAFFGLAKLLSGRRFRLRAFFPQRRDARPLLSAFFVGDPAFIGETLFVSFPPGSSAFFCSSAAPQRGASPRFLGDPILFGAALGLRLLLFLGAPLHVGGCALLVDFLGDALFLRAALFDAASPAASFGFEAARFASASSMKRSSSALLSSSALTLGLLGGALLFGLALLGFARARSSISASSALRRFAAAASLPASATFFLPPCRVRELLGQSMGRLVVGEGRSGEHGKHRGHSHCCRFYVVPGLPAWASSTLNERSATACCTCQMNGADTAMDGESASSANVGRDNSLIGSSQMISATKRMT